MRASRGMGCINPSKMPKAKKIIRKDNPNEVTEYAEGGAVSGLYANIHKKRARIAAGSGEKMRKPGTQGAPTQEAFKKASRTRKK